MISGKVKRDCLLQSVKIDSGANRAPYTVDRVSSSFGRGEVKWQKLKTDNSPQSSAEIKNDGANSSISPKVITA
jgi:hypothetical protein